MVLFPHLSRSKSIGRSSAGSLRFHGDLKLSVRMSCASELQLASFGLPVVRPTREISSSSCCRLPLHFCSVLGITSELITGGTGLQVFVGGVGEGMFSVFIQEVSVRSTAVIIHSCAVEDA